MSAKWIRSKEWERRHLTGWWTPLRWILHTFSLVRTAVFLLILVVLYGVAASVPIGLLALIPTYLVYTLTVIVAVVLVAVLPTVAMSHWLGSMRMSHGLRFAVGLFSGVVLGLGALWLWWTLAWPHLRYDPVKHEGLRFFAGFVERYKAVPLRRLPGMEMSELEFYGWWPLSTILLLFVINLIVATIRRIEFIFPNIGVLAVHTGIVTIALGSAYYGSLKQEGDMLLVAGQPDATTGKPSPGAWETGFFDNTRVVLRVKEQGDRWEQRLLRGLPRYNHYNLDVLGSPLGAGMVEDYGPIDVPAIAPPRDPAAPAPVGSDVELRVVGYAAYAELQPMWRPVTQAEAQRVGATPGRSPTPVRIVDVVVRTQSEQGGASERVIPVFLTPTLPASRIRSFQGAVNIEYTSGLSESRWQELRQPLPEGAAHALLVRLPGDAAPRIHAVMPSQRITVGEGADAWTLEVRSIAPEPPFPIITPGYQGAQSSLMIVRVTPPPSAGPQARPFDRYIYHRFPELNQDLSVERNEQGMPVRRAADSAISLAYLDASAVQIYLDERPSDGAAEPRVRAIIRWPGRPVQEQADVAASGSLQIAPLVSLRLGQRWSDARQVNVPIPVAESRQDRNSIGNHKRAAVAVEVSLRGEAGGPARWSDVAWVPFMQYGSERTDGRAEGVPVALPDGRTVEIVFGRLWHQLPGIALRLTDFEMIPYPHSEVPRDYRSEVQVIRGGGTAQQEMEPAATSLNEPLKVSAFVWSGEHGWLTNALGWVFSRLGPSQFKFSQAGWDSQGWKQTQEQVASGGLKRPFARFTILGVGNNPGIYIIASGAVLMAVGIPWAFYVKPWLIRRAKRRIQVELARGGPPAAKASHAPPGVNGTSEPARDAQRASEA